MAANVDLLVTSGQPSGASLGEIMGEMRDWMNANKIQPRAFKTVVSEGRLAFEVEFLTEDEAQLFRQRFT